MSNKHIPHIPSELLSVWRNVYLSQRLTQYTENSSVTFKLSIKWTVKGRSFTQRKLDRLKHSLYHYSSLKVSVQKLAAFSKSSKEGLKKETSYSLWPLISWLELMLPTTTQALRSSDKEGNHVNDCSTDLSSHLPANREKEKSSWKQSLLFQPSNLSGASHISPWFQWSYLLQI